MSPPLVLALLWMVAANLAATVSVRDTHLKALAGVLIVSGIPILGLVTWSHGALAGMLLLGAGASMLRWPLVHVGRWSGRRGDAAGRTTTGATAHPAGHPVARLGE